MEEQHHDGLDPARAEALAAVLGLPFDPAAPLLHFAHQVYFWDVRPAPGLGRDGHPKLGGLVPDLGLPRRMWAGGRLEFHAPLYPGRPAEKLSVREAVTRKEGRTGPLGFVTLRHEIRQDGRLAVIEWQDLVYREKSDPAAPRPAPPPAPEGEAKAVARAFSPTDLFRYSGLTMNGHRIHYDADYARGVEGYPGLVVHAPLLAQHLVLMAEQPLRRFSFRATAPLFAGEEAAFCRAGARLWVRGPDGRLCLEAEAG
ncbi:MAG: acyl dehydratase [Paracoccaceae bacterium]|nr:acyl dehydratase [Paracoccaceae bacterium]